MLTADNEDVVFFLFVFLKMIFLSINIAVCVLSRSLATVAFRLIYIEFIPQLAKRSKTAH